MHLVFETIRWKNLLSTGNDFIEFNLNSSKTTIISGANGQGKSILLDALCFVLFGKPFRKITKPQLINSINKKNCVVEIEFYAGKDKFKIIRGMKPNIFDIIKNDEKINQDSTTKDYQSILEKYILKLNFKSFSQVVILGSASFIPFMQLAAAHRREIIEDLLDIQIFTTMNLLLKEKINSNTKDLLEIEYKYDLNSEKIKLNEEHMQSIIRNSQELIDEYQDKIANYKKDIENETKIIEEKRDIQSKLIENTVDQEKIIKRISEMNSIKNKLSHKVERLHEEIDFFHDHDTCPICSQNIDLQFKTNNIERKKLQISESENGLSAIEEKYIEADNKLKELNKILDKISSINIDINIKNNKIKSIQNSINDLNEQIVKINNKNANYISDNNILKELEIESLKIADQKKELLELKDIYKISSIILKDNGIKAKIIKQYIPIINKLINKYLSTMNFYVQFELDENFNETIKSRFRDEFSYSSFSEGEKAKIDLALLFTWRTISKLRNSASTNILLLDEVFDGSLDASSSDELLKILIELSSDSNIIVITHKTEQLMDKFERSIVFEKHNNFSKMIES
jgi:DNA repair exonuclease SbcCD ATPase subunit